MKFYQSITVDASKIAILDSCHYSTSMNLHCIFTEYMYIAQQTMTFPCDIKSW